MYSSAEYPYFDLWLKTEGQCRKIAAYDEALQRVYICIDGIDCAVDLPSDVTFAEAVHLLRRFFWWCPADTIPETYNQEAGNGRETERR